MKNKPFALYRKNKNSATLLQSFYLLFRFLKHHMLSEFFGILFEFNFSRNLLLVLARPIVDALARLTREFD